MMKTNRWIRWLLLFAVIPLLVTWVGFNVAWQVRSWLASQTPGLSAKTIELDGRPYHYAVVEPVADRFDGPRPLVVFLHSATECGTDGILPAIKISPAFLACCREQAGAIILLPQFPRHDQGWNMGWHSLILRLVERARQDYVVDARRIYLVGMSLGGQGCWHLGADRPDLFAAVVPICGNGSASTLAPRLTGIPIWAFHGSDDRVIPVQGSRDLVAAIKEAGGQRVRYTEYQGVGHNCWDRALTKPELMDWLFRQSGDAAPGKQPAASVQAGN
jgi:predicted peptidase